MEIFVALVTLQTALDDIAKDNNDNHYMYKYIKLTSKVLHIIYIESMYILCRTFDVNITCSLPTTSACTTIRSYTRVRTSQMIYSIYSV